MGCFHAVPLRSLFKLPLHMYSKMSKRTFLHPAVGSKLLLLHYFGFLMSEIIVLYIRMRRFCSFCLVFWTGEDFLFKVIKIWFRNIKEYLISPFSLAGLLLIVLNPVDPAKTSPGITIMFRFCQIKSVEYAITSHLEFVQWNSFNIEACWIHIVFIPIP